jgi:hypothetical protein
MGRRKGRKGRRGDKVEGRKDALHKLRWITRPMKEASNRNDGQ